MPVSVSAEVAEARGADGRTFRRARFLRPAGDSRDGYPGRCGSGELVLSRGAAAAPEVVGGESEDEKSETHSEMFEAVGVMHCGIESVGHQSRGGENEEQRGPRVTGSAIRARCSRPHAAQGKNACRPESVENPANKNHAANQLGKVDRKSTRLNSSHGYISYAVFCLKKKKS